VCPPLRQDHVLAPALLCAGMACGLTASACAGLLSTGMRSVHEGLLSVSIIDHSVRVPGRPFHSWHYSTPPVAPETIPLGKTCPIEQPTCHRS